MKPDLIRFDFQSKIVGIHDDGTVVSEEKSHLVVGEEAKIQRGQIIFLIIKELDFHLKIPRNEFDDLIEKVLNARRDQMTAVEF